MSLNTLRYAARCARNAILAVMLVTIASSVDFTSVPLAAQESEERDANDDIDDVWFRVLRQNDAPVKMQTSVVRYCGQYVADDGTQRNVYVDLIGAVHIAEKKYYDELNEIFKEYETVVYELVSNGDAPAPAEVKEEREKKIQIGANPLGWISILQQGFGSALGLAYQMDGIDYGADNMRRGDCTPDELLLQTLANGDVLSFLMDAVVDAFFSSDSPNGDAMLLALLCAKDRRLAARRIFALELERSSVEELQREMNALEFDEEDDDVSGLFDQNHESAVIHFRNDKALEVVEEELDAGRTKIAVFYGAGHMPDLGAKIEDYFEFERAPEIRWITAWDMTSGNDKQKEE
ncbi:MAG: hypothetical protein IJU03_11070 [Thermoguttaceae bacterium]|nr:hypothetical protein [Thermoguttaceae bacterium]